MTPDPVAALLGAIDARIAASAPPEARLGVIEALNPLRVRLDSGQVLVPAVGSYTASDVDLAVGGRVVAIPIQEGHDWFVVSAEPA